MLGIISPVLAGHSSPPLAILSVFSSDAPKPAHRFVNSITTALSLGKCWRLYWSGKKETQIAGYHGSFKEMKQNVLPVEMMGCVTQGHPAPIGIRHQKIAPYFLAISTEWT